mgnify:FL=1
MINRAKIESLIQSYLEKSSLFLVDITISKDNDIEITIESYDRVDIENCADISRIVEQGLDRNVEDYSLTVTSAGLDQPFKVFDQYKKSVGGEVVVVLKSGEKIVATLTGATEEKIDLKWTKLVKPEGKKRKESIEVTASYMLEDIKSTKTFINFK